MLRGIAHPAVVRIQLGDQPGAARLGQGHPAKISGRRTFRHNAPDPAQRPGLRETPLINLLAQIGREIDAVLNDSAVKIDHVERAIRTVEDIHRPEALVSRSEKLGAFVGIAALDRAILGCQPDALHQIPRGLRDERIPTEFSREKRAAINDRTAGGGHRVLATRLIERVVAAVDAGGDAAWRNVEIGRRDLDVRARGREVGVAAQILRGDQIDTERIAVAVVEQAAAVILRDAPLPAHDGRLAGETSLALITEAGIEICRVNPVVHRPHQAVGIVLGVVDIAVILRDLDLLVRPTITVGVAAEPKMRRLGDEHAVSDQRHRAGQHQSIHEYAALVVATVTVGVLEHRDHADGFALVLAVGIGHEAAHLQHPESAIGTKLDGDRIANERICRHRLDAEAGRQFEGLQCLGRGKGRRGRNDHRSRGRGLHFTGPIAILRHHGRRQQHNQGKITEGFHSSRKQRGRVGAQKVSICRRYAAWWSSPGKARLNLRVLEIRRLTGPKGSACYVLANRPRLPIVCANR